MVTAGIAWELAAATGGRFVLGLGSQVKSHIERRYSAEFSPPGPRMKEYVQSVKAIFRAFRGEEKLAFEGKYYHFSLLPGAWSPGPIDVPDPPVYVSAVLPYMSRLVGEVADGIHIHPFHSPEYVRDVQRKAIEEGLARSGRKLDAITFSVPIMTAVGDSDEELAKTREHTRMMIAFYGSTPNYAPMFEHHGFDGVSERLHEYQKKGDIKGMLSVVTDDVLAPYTIAVELERSRSEARGALSGSRAQGPRDVVHRRRRPGPIRPPARNGPTWRRPCATPAEAARIQTRRPRPAPPRSRKGRGGTSI